MPDATLSLNVPLRLGTDADGRYIVACDRVPMLLVGKDVTDATTHAERALRLAAEYVLAFGPGPARGYFKRRGVDFTLTVHGGSLAGGGFGGPSFGAGGFGGLVGGNVNTPYTLGGGVLVHGGD